MFYKNKFKKFGLSSSQVKAFKKNNVNSVTNIKFKGYDLKISNPYWFLHSIEELFIDEVYKFSSLTDSPLIIDCGANWGLSVIYFKELYPNAAIIAFEADPDIYKLLKSNISSCKLENIELVNKAVWIKNEILRFSTDGGLGGTLTDLGIKEKNIKEIESVKLKDILASYKRVDFLKIDIEGAEYEVIKDCAEALSVVNTLFVEYHSTPKNPQSLDEILHILKAAGFRYYIKEAWNNMSHPFVDSKELYYDLQLNIFCFR